MSVRIYKMKFKILKRSGLFNFQCKLLIFLKQFGEWTDKSTEIRNEFA